MRIIKYVIKNKDGKYVSSYSKTYLDEYSVKESIYEAFQFTRDSICQKTVMILNQTNAVSYVKNFRWAECFMVEIEITENGIRELKIYE